MSMYASWIHGNALTVESPENLDRIIHIGWGTDLLIKPRKATWLHIPLPTPVVVGDRQAHLQRVFVLFNSDQGEIRHVHVYDGSSKIQEFNGLHLRGEHRLSLNGLEQVRPALLHWPIASPDGRKSSTAEQRVRRIRR